MFVLDQGQTVGKLALTKDKMCEPLEIFMLV